MALIDDLAAPTPDEELDRRKALGVLTGGALAVAGLGTVITTVQYLQPNVLFEPATKVPIGPLDSIEVGALLVLTEQKLYVIRTPEGVFAMGSQCTHLGCMTRYEQAKHQIVCPCHGSHFDETGKVTGGPAPRPLFRKYVSIENGQVVVDTSRNVDDDFILAT